LDECASWTSLGLCLRTDSTGSYMRQVCRASCCTAKCSSSASPAASPASPAASSCVNLYDSTDATKCGSWSAAGFCQQPGFTEFMSANCAKSCELC
jgi:hypothetical protein